MSQRSRRRRQRVQVSGRKKMLLALGIPLAVSSLAIAVGIVWLVSIYDSAPSLATLRPITKGAVSKVCAAAASLIGGLPPKKTPQPIASDRIPEDLKNATIAIEDRRFYQHGGIDPS